MGPVSRIRVLVAGGDDLALDALCRRIASWPTIEIVGWARSGLEVTSLTEELVPDLVLIDIENQNGDRVAAIRGIKQTVGSPIVVILDSRDTPAARRDSFAAGADAFVKKSEPDEKLRALISKIRPCS